jgi:hypothetical protein
MLLRATREAEFKMKRRILFVALQNSPHVARWIDLVADMDCDLHVFGVDQAAPNEKLRGVTLHWPILSAKLRQLKSSNHNVVTEPSVPSTSVFRRIARFSRLTLRNPGQAVRRLTVHTTRFRQHAKSWARLPRFLGRFRTQKSMASADAKQPAGPVKVHRFQPSLSELGGADAVSSGSVRLGESDCAAPVLNGPGVLAHVVRRLQPDLIHSMEFQHAGYLVLQTRELYGGDFPTWLATNWGSDIFYFGRFPDHRAQIQRLLKAIDFYSCECKRDIAIARQFGYGGPVLPNLPNSGGFDLKHVRSLRSPEPPSQRKLLMIKGYQHFAGRAMVALHVLENFATQLKGYRIVLFSVSTEPRRRAFELKEKGVLDIEVIDLATHDEIMSRFGQARLYMGISISDAISTSVLEAMAMGAFPIQTDTSCCDEWFTDGEGGFIVPPDDFDLICDRFFRALRDDNLVDRAAEINWRTVQARLDRTILSAQAVRFYDQIFAGPQHGSQSR